VYKMVNSMKKQRRNSRFKPFSVILLLLVGVFILVLLPQINAFDWSDDLISHYNFDETSGTVAIDSTDNTNGTIVGAVTFVDGKIGGGYDFPGGDGKYVNPKYDVQTINSSYSFWVNMSEYGAVYSHIFTMGYLGASSPLPSQFAYWADGTQFRFYVSAGEPDLVTAWKPNLNQWYHVVITENNYTMKMYINGTLEDTQTWESHINGNITIGALRDTSSLHGVMDEIGIWDRTLSQAEVTELYNAGSGLTYELPSGLTVSLISPSNDSLISDVGTTFIVNITTESIALQNITYYIWMTNGTSINVTTFDMDPAVSNSSSEYIDNFGLGDYLWNVKATGDNATGTFSSWATDNRSFEVVPFSKVAESYSDDTIEGSTELFSVNLSMLTGYRISEIRFFYNGISYATSYNEYISNYFYVTRTHSIPIVNANTNVTFYWNVTLESGDSLASKTENQTIHNLVLDNCSSGNYVLFNFTMVDEDSQTFLVGATENTSLKINLILSTLSNGFLGFNYSGAFDDTNPCAVCSNVALGDSTFRADLLAEYKADNKFTEYYNIQNYVLTNTTDYQNITLYNLNSSTGTEFKITYKDSNFNLVPGAIIQIQRKYIDEGIFKTIEIPLISSAGYTIGHLIRNDVIYNLIVLKDGVILDSFTNIVADCQNPTLSQCVININSFSSAVSPESFSSTGDFSSTLTYNATTRVVTSVFVIPSGVPSVTTLNVTLIDGFGETTICADQLNAAGGTLTCTVPDTFGNSTVIAQVWNNGDLKMQRTISLAEDPSQIYGSSLIFISLTIMLLIIGMSITDNPMILGIMLVFGIIILTVLNMVNSFGWIGPGATILWLVVAIIIILIKGSNRQ